VQASKRQDWKARTSVDLTSKIVWWWTATVVDRQPTNAWGGDDDNGSSACGRETPERTPGLLLLWGVLPCAHGPGRMGERARVQFATASTQVQYARYSLRHRAVPENRNTKG
jgi:hypothetical protein